MYKISKCVVQEAIINLGIAFRGFFERKTGYPRFKNKNSRDSFCVSNLIRGSIFNGKRIRLPLIGWVKMAETPRFNGVVKRVSVVREASRWFAVVLFDVNSSEDTKHQHSVIGVDLGIKTLATLSQGDSIPGPKAHKSLLAKVRRLSRSLSRKQKNSANRRKAQRKLARCHARIANIRKDATHKATTYLTQTYARIGIEDLNVRGMVRNRRLARHIMDAGFGEFRRQLAYKSERTGSILVVADRWFPSSKKCSCCGSVKTELALSQRTYSCDDCGLVIDRDLNAARNLENLAVISTVTVCGEVRSGLGCKPRVKRPLTKQKPDTKVVA